jgi:hypothetical protein
LPATDSTPPSVDSPWRPADPASCPADAATRPLGSASRAGDGVSGPAAPDPASPSLLHPGSSFGPPPGPCSTAAVDVGAGTWVSAWTDAGGEPGRPGSPSGPGGGAGGGCPPPGCAEPACCSGGAATGSRTGCSPPGADGPEPGSAWAWPDVTGGASGARSPGPGGGAASPGRGAANRLASGVDVLVSSELSSGEGSDSDGSAGSGPSGGGDPDREVGSVVWSTQAPSCGPPGGRWAQPIEAGTLLRRLSTTWEVPYRRPPLRVRLEPSRSQRCQLQKESPWPSRPTRLSRECSP